MKRCIIYLTILHLTMTVAGCGFGGLTDKSSNGSSSASTDKAAEVTGLVSKGIFNKGAVEIYAVDSSGEERLLKTASIGPFGNYSATIRTAKDFTGVVVVKAYGSYIDEATGAELTISQGTPLRAAFVNPSGEHLAMVTPLTELAVRKALGTGTTLAAAGVTAANSLVSGLFKVDIMTTKPVRSDLSDEGFGNAATTQEQKDYTLALAAVSQMASDSGTLSDAMGVLYRTVSTEGSSPDGAYAFRSALDRFLVSDHNQTGLTDVHQTNLASAGGTTREVKLSLAGKLPPGFTINGVSLTLNLPPGVTVKGDYSDPLVVRPLEGVVKGSGVSAAGIYAEARYLQESGTTSGRVRVSLISAAGFYLGEFVTIRCEVMPATSPQPGEFTVSDFMAKDGNGAILSTVDVERPLQVQ